MVLWINDEQESQRPADISTTLLKVGATAEHGCTAPFLETAREALVQVEQRRCLPLDYLDVTQGWFASWKRWIKRKLLGNIKRG